MLAVGAAAQAWLSDLLKESGSEGPLPQFPADQGPAEQLPEHPVPAVQSAVQSARDARLDGQPGTDAGTQPSDVQLTAASRTQAGSGRTSLAEADLPESATLAKCTISATSGASSARACSDGTAGGGPAAASAGNGCTAGSGAADAGNQEAAATAAAANSGNEDDAEVLPDQDTGLEEEEYAPGPCLSPEIEEAHAQAEARGQSTYKDPATGYTVRPHVLHKRPGGGLRLGWHVAGASSLVCCTVLRWCETLWEQQREEDGIMDIFMDILCSSISCIYSIMDILWIH